MGRVRLRVWRAAPKSTDALWDAVEEALARATRRQMAAARHACNAAWWVHAWPLVPTAPAITCTGSRSRFIPLTYWLPSAVPSPHNSLSCPRWCSHSRMSLWPNHITSWSCGPWPLSNVVTESHPTSLCPHPFGLAPSYLPSSPHTTTLRCVRQRALAHWSYPCSPGSPRHKDGRSKPSTTLGRPLRGFHLMCAHAVTCRSYNVRCRLLPWSPRTPRRRDFECVALC